ncbi:glycosyltransferase family 2 protein [Candidatus Woesearchaeota archaeon]|jgi:glycosyltransferase involved in cell wall biosynthesis|nr:glycosyltransferase family 2 protein [Candidatus Woesearchaeota archaeon]
MDISIIIPAYNEEKNIVPICEEVIESLDKMDVIYEIVLVDDGSSDNTFDAMSVAKNTYDNIEIVKFNKNYKKSAAYMAGIKKSCGDIVVTIDADLQDDPSEIKKMVSLIGEYDVVVGWKENRVDSVTKVVPSRLFNWINKKLFGISLKDNDSGFRVMTKEAANKLDLYGDLYRFIPALLANKGYSITEVSVNHRSRNSGKSKYGYSRFLTGLLDILTMKLILDFNNRPSHLFGYLALGMIIIGLFAEFIAIFDKFFLGYLFSTHMPPMIFGVMAMILGVSFFGIGLLGELIVYQKRNKNLYELDDRKI